MSLEWAAAAAIIVAATFVFGLAGFGIGLVALSLLPFFMTSATAVPLVTIYAALIALGVTVSLRRDVLVRRLGELLVGTAVGAPVGVWALAALPAGTVKRLIGLVLIVVVLLEVRGRYPAQLGGRGWGVAAGAGAGMLGGETGHALVEERDSSGRRARVARAQLTVGTSPLLPRGRAAGGTTPS